MWVCVCVCSGSRKNEIGIRFGCSKLNFVTNTISIFGVGKKRGKRNNLLGMMCFYLDWNWSWNKCASSTHTIQLQIVAYDDLFLCVDSYIRLKSSVITMKTKQRRAKPKTEIKSEESERQHALAWNVHWMHIFHLKNGYKYSHTQTQLLFLMFSNLFFLSPPVSELLHARIACQAQTVKKWTKISWNGQSFASAIPVDQR